jgi:glycosyltransferase involved in cell wall biosynthesis
MSTGSKKKVIHHLLYSGLGGHGSVFFSLAEADDNREFEYRAVFCGIEKLRDEYSERCTRLQIHFEYVSKKKGLDIGVYWKLFRNFRRSRPGTIFLHGVSFLMPAVWYKIIRPSCAILVRDTQAHHLKSKAEWFWLFFCFFFSKKIVVLTDASAEGMRKKFGRWISPDRLVVIPNGLNMEKYLPMAKPRGNGALKIGMQSRLQPIKDHPTLLRAFKKLLDKWPACSISLHIAGDGETMPAIKAMVRNLELENSVHLHGMLDQDELLRFMHSLDIYVHATFGEMQSNSIMQAMACGLPVIASDVWGVNNMIIPGDNGILYREEDEDQLMLELEQLVLSAQKRSELGLRARKFAEEHYSNDTMFARYRDLYLL